MEEIAIRSRLSVGSLPRHQDSDYFHLTMNEIEFSNNGETDTLTGVPAPAIFLERAQSEYFGSRRGGRTLSILSLNSAAHDSQMGEGQIVALARSIEREIRGEEFFCRISEEGFWIALRGGIHAGEKLAARVMSAPLVEQELWKIAVIESSSWSTFEQWLHAADVAHFTIQTH